MHQEGLTFDDRPEIFDKDKRMKFDLERDQIYANTKLEFTCS